MAPEFNRDKPGFRFEFGGVNIRDVPDALPLNKYCAAQNIRSTGAKAMRTRPGYVNLFAVADGAGVIDIRAFTALGTDNLPRLLAVDIFGEVFLDTGVDVVNLTAGGNGFSMLPFRPAESPQAWMYVAGQNGNYVKIQAPNANNNCVVHNVGIAEPQQSLDACPEFAETIIQLSGNSAVAANWTAGGNAGGLTNGNRTVDTLDGNALPDPAYTIRNYCAIRNTSALYSVGELVNVTTGNNTILQSIPVEDVIPGANVSIPVQAVRYQVGTNGNCVLALGQIPQNDHFIATVRRGAILNISNNSNNENILVLDAVTGPNGQVAIDTSTVGNWSLLPSNLTGVLSRALQPLCGG